MGFGHEAVVFFFVTSGFLVGGGVCECSRTRPLDWRRYLADRSSRLYAVLVFALLLGAMCDSIGSHYFNAFGFYSNQTPHPVAVIGGPFVERLDLSHFLASLFMLQEIALPSFGSNDPLWSLAHEWWYYLLFPLLLSGFSKENAPSGLLPLQ
ncbi:acyltransferase family protein [Novipirellula caenicola]|uniref:Acyltransferase 3 domain-containing protein n=1 Tax=Novipirellula caenicola TaxID=1536901 RepID=A0ABP9W123_9BACT